MLKKQSLYMLCFLVKNILYIIKTINIVHFNDKIIVIKNLKLSQKSEKRVSIAKNYQKNV